MRLFYSLGPLVLNLFLASQIFAEAKKLPPQRNVKPDSPEMIVGFAFDWDDNIFEMPTKIMLYDKTTKAEKGVSTEDFALIRSSIGKEGTEWANFELRTSPDGSLRFFGDQSSDGKARFSKDVSLAMNTKGYHWQGPVWNDFVAAMASLKTSRHTWIITARLHAPTTIHGALVGLQGKGLIKTVLPAQNIWAVSNEGFDRDFKREFKREAPEGGASDPSARKAAVMESILDGINKTSMPNDAPETIDVDGQGKRRQHLWGFSDDDFGNFSKAKSVLQKGVDAGRWPNVKITLFFTGTNHATEKPHAIVLRSNKEPRKFSETDEWKEILGKSDGRLLNLKP
jgi:hypothetical protein